MGKGSTSGEVGFPDYIEDIHAAWMVNRDDKEVNREDAYLPLSLRDVMSSMLMPGGSPYVGMHMTEPDDEFEEVETHHAQYEAYVGTLDAETRWEEFIGKAVEEIDECGVMKDVDLAPLVSAAQSGSDRAIRSAVQQAVEAIDDQAVIDVVEQFSESQDLEKARRLSEFDNLMAGIGAEHGSAFILGRAMLEMEHQRAVSQFEASARLEVYSQTVQSYLDTFRVLTANALEGEIRTKMNRDQMISESIGRMQQMYLTKVSMQETIVSLLTEIKRIKVVARHEYEGAEHDLEIAAALWDMEVFERGMQTLAAPSGMATRIPPKNSKAASVLGGALGGAAAGLEKGGLWGAAAGGVLGGLGGLLS